VIVPMHSYRISRQSVSKSRLQAWQNGKGHPSKQSSCQKLFAFLLESTYTIC